MSQAIYSGVTVEVDISAPYGWTTSPQDALDAIVAYLNKQGLVSVEDAALSASTQLNFLGAFAPGDFGAVLHVTPNTSTDTDTISQAVGQAIATTAQTSNYTVSIPVVAGAATGQPSGGTTLSGFFGSIGSSVQGFFSGVQSTTTTIVIAIVVLLVLVLVIVAFGPNVGAVAGALA